MALMPLEYSHVIHYSRQGLTNIYPRLPLHRATGRASKIPTNDTTVTRVHMFDVNKSAREGSRHYNRCARSSAGFSNRENEYSTLRFLSTLFFTNFFLPSRGTAICIVSVENARASKRKLREGNETLAD